LRRKAAVTAEHDDAARNLRFPRRERVAYARLAAAVNRNRPATTTCQP
jgi:hypothetical protein